MSVEEDLRQAREKLSALEEKIDRVNTELRDILERELGDDSVRQYLLRKIDEYFPLQKKAPETKAAKLRAIMAMTMTDEDKEKLIQALMEE